MADWHALLRDVADFPKPGITFKDMSPLLRDGDAFAAAIDAMAGPWRSERVEVVMGIESRGFILGAALACVLGTGFVPIRKPGKLPGRVLAQRYALEYGHDQIEVQADAVAEGTRVLLVDDVLATGGTLQAARVLAQRVEADVVGAAVLVEIGSLDGRARWQHAAPLRAALTV